MSIFETAGLTEAYQRQCEDRIAVFEEVQRAVIVVADGAGGIGSGAEAAEAVVREVKAAVRETTNADGWTGLLRQIDFRIGPGESTAVVVDVQLQGICGASVGDSQAWMIDEGELTILTEKQQRKPLLGSGDANPVGFNHVPLSGLLLVATDGFCNYVKRTDVVKAVLQNDFVSLPRNLLAMVRLKSGELWDDVGIVICRQRPKPIRVRRRYSLDDDANE
jgi:serine/threonine protein phosphatase PrpC